MAVAVGYKELVPGLTLGLTGTVPDTDSGAPLERRGHADGL